MKQGRGEKNQIFKKGKTIRNHARVSTPELDKKTHTNAVT